MQTILTMPSAHKIIAALRYTPALLILVFIWEAFSGYFSTMLMSHGYMLLGLSGLAGANYANLLCNLYDKHISDPIRASSSMKPTTIFLVMVGVMGTLVALYYLHIDSTDCPAEPHCQLRFWCAVFAVSGAGTAALYILPKAFLTNESVKT